MMAVARILKISCPCSCFRVSDADAIDDTVEPPAAWCYLLLANGLLSEQ
jgi:hypothetical protein